jgi:hypothetical protein
VIKRLQDTDPHSAPELRWGWADTGGRKGVLERGSVLTRAFSAGDLRGNIDAIEADAMRAEEEGRLDEAASTWAHSFRVRMALGEFDIARSNRQRGIALSRRLPGIGNSVAQLAGANRVIRAMFTNEGWPPLLDFFKAADEMALPQLAIMHATTRCYLALSAAGCGEKELAKQSVSKLLPAMDRGIPWSTDYADIVFSSATALWWIDEPEMVEPIERNLREKIIVPDYRNPRGDSRLSLAYLCTLNGRLDEARQWFDKARVELEAQEARPLRAIVDFDEAWALVRAEGLALSDEGFPDSTRAEVENLLRQAVAQFEEIGMPGWIRNADALRSGEEIFAPAME